MKLMFSVDEIYVMKALVAMGNSRARCGIKG
jgi:hypothetical protein